MSAFPYDERRKNSSRKRQISFDIVYQVHWNRVRHTFDVYRNGENTGAFARDKVSAIRDAIRAAQQEDDSLKISVSAIQNGKMTVEWSR